jgi:hypothetical protein
MITAMWGLVLADVPGAILSGSRVSWTGSRSDELTGRVP